MQTVVAAMTCLRESLSSVECRGNATTLNPQLSASPRSKSESWWTFRIFFILVCSAEGEGGSKAPGREGARFFIQNPRRGGGREGVYTELGGLNVFSGPKFPPRSAPSPGDDLRSKSAI